MSAREFTRTRLNRGLYQAVFPSGHTYQIELFPDGAWLLFRVLTGGREYWSDFSTKREALAHATQVESWLPSRNQ